jgi:4-hydroxybenzoate polyprenyltransferase
MHVISFVCFLLLGAAASLGWIYYAGVALSGLIMVYEHSLVKPDDLSKLNFAFFTMNGILSMVMFIFSLGDMYL